METEKSGKIQRVLQIYTDLINGSTINKSELAGRYGVAERSIQRDMEDVRNFLDLEGIRTGVLHTIVYDRRKKGYRLDQLPGLKLSNSEILAICKILLDSRAFTRPEMLRMLEKLIDCCVPAEQKKLVAGLVNNEAFHYVEPHHKKVFLDLLWPMGQAIQSCHYIEIQYTRLKGNQTVTRKVRPAAILFSEYYFYLAAFIGDEEMKKDFDVPDDPYPTIYRIDRVKKMTVLKERFHVLYANRFEEGEFRKRIQFMYGGRLQQIKFKYSGLSIEAVLDRLPTAQILAEEDGVYTVSAEVFGTGIHMWLRSQGDAVELLEERYPPAMNTGSYFYAKENDNGQKLS